MRLSSETKKPIWQVPSPPSDKVRVAGRSPWDFRADPTDAVDMRPVVFHHGHVVEHKDAKYALGRILADNGIFFERLAGQKGPNGPLLFAVRQYRRDYSHEYDRSRAATDQSRLAGFAHTRKSHFILEERYGDYSLQFLPLVRHTLSELLQAPGFKTPTARMALATHMLPLVGAVQTLCRTEWGLESHGDITPFNIVFDSNLNPLLDNFARDPYAYRKHANYTSLPYLAPETFQKNWQLKSGDNPYRSKGLKKGERPAFYYHTNKGADLFALGAVLLETAVGINPFLPSNTSFDLETRAQSYNFMQAMHATIEREYPNIIHWLEGGKFPTARTRLLQRSQEERWARPFFVALSKADRYQRPLHVAFNLLHPNPEQRGRLFEETTFEPDANAAFLVEVLAQKASSYTLETLEMCEVLGPKPTVQVSTW